MIASNISSSNPWTERTEPTTKPTVDIQTMVLSAGGRRIRTGQCVKVESVGCYLKYDTKDDSVVVGRFCLKDSEPSLVQMCQDARQVLGCKSLGWFRMGGNVGITLSFEEREYAGAVKQWFDQQPNTWFFNVQSV